jgi:hypothetical protein
VQATALIDSGGIPGHASGTARRLDRLSLLFWSALALSLTARIALGWTLPLWFDEVYTGTIASQGDGAGLLGWCLAEITGPAFYVPMWFWAKVAGTSDAALRLPALLFSIAGPALIAWRGHPDRNVRLYWAIFSLLWLPMLPLATEARPYPQLFFLGALQAIVFLRLSKSASLREAFGWTTVTAFFVLTNYYALVISGFQALALLATHRRKLLNLYPALLPLLLVGVWMPFHLPVVLRFAAEHGTMFTPLPPTAIFGVPWLLFGPGIQAFAVVMLLAFTFSAWWGARGKLSPEAQLVCTGIAAFALILIVGLFRATLTPRYVTAGIPALLFGLAWWAAKVRTQKPMAVAAMLGLFFFSTVSTLVTGSTDDRFRDRRDLQFETASAWLMKAPVDRLYYLKPERSPAPARDAEIAAFFFTRAGRPVKVIQSDYKSAMTPALGGDRRAGVLFIGDTPASARLTSWMRDQPSGWACRNFGQTAFAIMACRPQAPALSASTVRPFSLTSAKPPVTGMRSG